MWFSLPLDVRLDIYKRSRFLNARERLEKKLATRSRPVLQKSWIGTSIYIASFRITNDKLINLEYHNRCDQDYDLIIVDTCDYSQIAVFLHVNNDDRIVLHIATEKSVRTGVRRTYECILKFNLFTSTYTQWYKDRRSIFKTSK
jgi:hypothetical protein